MCFQLIESSNNGILSFKKHSIKCKNPSVLFSQLIKTFINVIRKFRSSAKIRRFFFGSWSKLFKWIYVGNVFWLPIRQSKFFGTIEFLVSIYGKTLVILSPNLDILYRSLDFKYIQICRPFCTLENLSYKSMKASC